MSHFSNDPKEATKKALYSGHTGVRIKQGVPLLDRDLNLLGDLPLAQLRVLTRDFIGNGVPEGSDAFRISAYDDEDERDNEVYVEPGVCLVDGHQIHLERRTLFSELVGQGKADEMPGPPEESESPRTDLIYLQLFKEPRDLDFIEPDLGLGEATSVRSEVVWMLRVAEGTETVPPEAEEDAVTIRLATVERHPGESRITSSDIATIDSETNITDLSNVAKEIATIKRDLEALKARSSPATLIVPARNFEIDPFFDTDSTLPVPLGASPNKLAIIGRLDTGLPADMRSRSVFGIASRSGDNSHSQTGTVCYGSANSFGTGATRTSLFEARERPDSALVARLHISDWNDGEVVLTWSASNRDNVRHNHIQLRLVGIWSF